MRGLGATGSFKGSGANLFSIVCKNHLRPWGRRLVMETAAAVLVLAIFGQAQASYTWEGGDWGGRDLTPANGDVLSGTFINVGHFLINAGETVFAGSGLVSLTTHDSVIDGLFYGGPRLASVLDLRSETGIVLNGTLDQWTSVTFASGGTISVAGSISILNSSGGITVFTPPVSGVVLASGGPYSGSKGDGGFLQNPIDGSWSIGGGSISLNAVPLPSTIFFLAPALVGILFMRRDRGLAGYLAHLLDR